MSSYAGLDPSITEFRGTAIAKLIVTAIIVIASAGCSDATTRCGEGTHEEDSTCLPDPPTDSALAPSLDGTYVLVVGEIRSVDIGGGCFGLDSPLDYAGLTLTLAGELATLTESRNALMDQCGDQSPSTGSINSAGAFAVSCSGGENGKDVSLDILGMVKAGEVDGSLTVHWALSAINKECSVAARIISK
jgi:hypothetical protein